MIRKLLVSMLVSMSIFMAHAGASLSELPRELQLKILNLDLRDTQISYKPGAPCMAMIGINVRGKKVAFVALRYIGSGNTFKWTPLTPVPFDQENDKFGIIYQDNKVVVLQSSSALNDENVSGYHVEFAGENKPVILRPIGQFRIALEDETDVLTFACNS